MIDKSKIRKERVAFALKTMVKVFIILVIVFSIRLTVGIGSWKDAEVNNLKIFYSKVERDAVPSIYEWDGDMEKLTITIPDEYEGIKINSLSGFVGRGAPVNFYVDIPETYIPLTNTSETKYPNSYVAEDYDEYEEKINEETDIYTFTVKLGKNIKYLEDLDYREYHHEYNGNVVYVVEYYYECSPENKWFYSKDGKVYDKKTDELID